jgi:hypothetical protein
MTVTATTSRLVMMPRSSISRHYETTHSCYDASLQDSTWSYPHRLVKTQLPSITCRRATPSTIAQSPAATRRSVGPVYALLTTVCSPSKQVYAPLLPAIARSPVGPVYAPLLPAIARSLVGPVRRPELPPARRSSPDTRA